MAEQHLTKSELAIMEVMWEQEEALTASEIIKASGYGKYSSSREEKDLYAAVKRSGRNRDT